MGKVISGLPIALMMALMACQLADIADLSKFSPHLLSKAFIVGAGAGESVPARVLVAEDLVGAMGAPSIALSPGLSDDALFHQRFSERIYPMRVVAASSVHLRLNDEPAPEGCEEVGGSEDLLLYRCGDAEN